MRAQECSLPGARMLLGVHTPWRTIPRGTLEDLGTLVPRHALAQVRWLGCAGPPRAHPGACPSMRMHCMHALMYALHALSLRTSHAPRALRNSISCMESVVMISENLLQFPMIQCFNHEGFGGTVMFQRAIVSHL